MKAKQWVSELALHCEAMRSTDEETAQAAFDQYTQGIDRLAVESKAVLGDRLKNIRMDRFGARGARERIIAAYREAYVKWDAVLHALTLRLGEAPPFPFFRSCLILNLYSNLLEDVEDNKIGPSEARQSLEEFNVVAAALSVNDALIASISKSIHARLTGTFEARLNLMFEDLEKAVAKCDTPGERMRTLQRSDELRSFLTSPEFHNLSALKQMQYYYTLAQHIEGD